MLMRAACPLCSAHLSESSICDLWHLDIWICYFMLHLLHPHLWNDVIKAVECVQMGSLKWWGHDWHSSLDHIQSPNDWLFPETWKGWSWNAKFKKPCLSLSLISSSKQMRESIWDESKSLALSLPLRVTRVIHLQCSIWRGSQTLPWTSSPFPLPLELLWIKRLSFIPPTIPAVWCLVFWAHCVMEIKRRLSGANRHLYKWGFSPVHTLCYCQSKMN